MTELPNHTPPIPTFRERCRNAVGWFGAILLDAIRETGGVGLLLFDTAYWTVVSPLQGKFPRANFGKQLIEEGVKSILIVFVLSFVVGLIIAMQTSYQLQLLGMVSYMPPLVAIVTVRELGPLIAAIIISGRVGAAIAAELGTMVVAEEIDAMRSMALNPIRFLVVPRVLALLIMLVCLSMLANFASIFGAFVWGLKFNITWSSFQYLAFQMMMKDWDILQGLIKSAFFALLISGIGCYKGLRVSGGAEGVGAATTDTVVHSIFAIIIVDGLFTLIFVFFFPNLGNL